MPTSSSPPVSGPPPGSSAPHPALSLAFLHERPLSPHAALRPFSFQKAYNRIKAVFSATTEEQVARALGISAASLQENRKLHLVPRQWLETLLFEQRVPPLWVLFGHEPRFLKDKDPLDAEFGRALLDEAERIRAKTPPIRSTAGAGKR